MNTQLRRGLHAAWVSACAPPGRRRLLPTHAKLCAIQVADGLWTFEQPQKLSGTDVHINVRMTAVQLSSGGLLIYSPIAPTRHTPAPP